MTGKVENSFYLPSQMVHYGFFFNADQRRVCDVNASIARKQTGQGFMCNMTIKGPHGSSDGNTSIFRGLSRVPAFFRNLERYLTLKARSQGISVW